MNKVLDYYVNGNYNVMIMENGTKIRFTNAEEFRPAFAESHDICITKECDGGCSFCYEGCSPMGKHAELDQPFFNTFHHGTEIAINGNDLTHPGLINFLDRMKKQRVIVNMTVNQKHFEKNFDKLKEWSDKELIRGLGISLVNPTEEFNEMVRQFPNAIIHVINGVVTIPQLKMLADNNFKLLILGYKKLQRGKDYYEANSSLVTILQEEMKNYLFSEIIPQNWFGIISFDNLALEQLDVHEHVDEATWNKTYLGEDGHFSFYIDAVTGTFARNSVAPANERYPIMDNVNDMFNFIREKEDNND